jgi:hypothetical protein
MSCDAPNGAKAALSLLDQHYTSFYSTVDIARQTGHPVPVDTRGWSQIIVSVLTGISGLKRKKGADFDDGSDVKAANTWEAIDIPRFNGVIKAGTKAKTAGKIGSLDAIPHLFLVLWDTKPDRTHRCRIWCVRPWHDPLFRKMCIKWYAQRERGEIISTNFQLHPPLGKDSNLIRNTCGNLNYPLLFSAERGEGNYELKMFQAKIMQHGLCTKADPTAVPQLIGGAG